MDGEAPQWADLVADRLEFLERLEDPAHKPALESDLDYSRSTVDRAIRKLEAAGLIERTTEGYATTPTGRLAARRYRDYAADQRTLEEARPIMSVLPPGAAPPGAVLSGGTVEANGEDGYSGRSFDRIARRLRTAATYRAVLPTIADSRHLRLLHARVLNDDLTAEVVIAPELADRLREEFAALTEDLLGATNCTLGCGEVPPYGLAVVEGSEHGDTDDDDRTALLTAYEDGTLQGVVENETAGALDRVGDIIDEYAATRDVIPDPRADAGMGTPVSASGMAISRTLSEAGVTRIDRSYFAERTPGDPATAWRIGFDLTEVYYGYPVKRTDADLTGSGAGNEPANVPGTDLNSEVESSSDSVSEQDQTPSDGRSDGGIESATDDAQSDTMDRPNVGDWLADQLAAGSDHLVVGPPGTGKSTVCKGVACRWVEAGHGPVYYREAMAGTQSDTDALLNLTAVLESTADENGDDDGSGHALVVVEDAATIPESVLSLLRRVRDDPSVVLLAEAREREWNEAVSEMTEPRMRELARTSLSTYRLPSVDQRTCRRAVETFEAVTGQRVPLSPSELHDQVHNEGGLGEMQVLGHQVTAHATPWLDDSVERSALDGDVRATYDTLAPDEDTTDPYATLPLTVGILTAALIGAEWEVAPGLLHAVAVDYGRDVGDDREPSDRAYRRVESVLDELDGRMFVRGTRPYRTQHPQWATHFLEHALERAERETVALFERGINAVLALADDSEARDRIQGWLGRDAAAVEQFADSEAVREFVTALFGLGLHHAALVPLFGTTEHSGIELDPAPPAAELEARSCRGKMLYDRGEGDRAEPELLALCETAAQTPVEETTRTRYEAEANRLLAEVLDDSGETDRARDRLERSLDAAREGDHPRHEVGALNSLAWVAMTVDDYDRAQTHLETAMSVAETEELTHTIPHSTTLYYTAKLRLFRGELAAAEERLEDVIELDRELGNERNVSYSLKLLGDIAKERGDEDRAADHYRRSIELKREVGDRRGRAHLLYDLGDLYLERGHPDRAASAFERSLTIAREDDLERLVGQAHSGLGTLALDRGNADEAAEYFETALAIHESLDNDRGVANAVIGLGDVARQREQFRTARDHYKEGFEHYRDHGDRREAAKAINRAIEVSLTIGDETAASKWCETGIEYAGDLDDWRERFTAQLSDLREGGTSD